MIGVLGGTFDPIHYGHLRPAQEVLHQLALAELRLMPAAQPPHRSVPVASAAQRLAMVQLAIGEFPGFRADARELARSGPSYTVLSLESLRAELGETPICLLMGVDQFASFETWHRWREIPALAHLVVMSRAGQQQPDWPAWARARISTDYHDLRETPAGRLAFVPVSPQDISATRLRAALAQGDSVQGLLPEAVMAYIQSNQLYSSEC